MKNVAESSAIAVHGEHGRSLSSVVVFVLLPFALAHFLSYLYRNVNAVVYPNLASELGLNANALGWLTSAYLLAFALAQLPIGVALDRYGCRRGQAPLMLVAAAGAMVFAHAHNLAELAIGRGLIGFGVAGSLMAAIKASSQWLPRERLSLSTSMLLAVGGFGAMASTSPMHAALRHIDWRQAFIVLGACTVAVSALIYFVVPEQPSVSQTARLKDMWRDVGQLFRSGSFWRLALYSIFAHATYMAVQGLWMGAWLRDVGQLDSGHTANVLLAGTVTMVAGSLFFGWLTDLLKRFGVKPITVCGGGIAVFLIFQTLMIWGHGTSPLLLACGFTFFGTATTMNYAIIAQSVPTHLTGRVSTSFNLLVFLLAFVIQAGLGGVIAHWPAQHGAYPVQAYQWALGINLALQCPGLLLWFAFRPWIRERVAAT
ncbi:MFS transporter [Trinickia violacea]|uniref:MFS transporter n=1 Tax=Trinickia violacea TaxID=2571746 RepID=A0A4P8J2D0_9BURK|nr:MFS transporter [Trinickia violacea]QCP55107.1 MFS transporter [Trinickia violacea]